MSSRRPPAADRDAGTRDRLLRAASRVFAEEGYDGATVREVCRRAHANVAAVSYHFGSKRRLYLETMRWAMTLSQADDTAELLAFASREGLSPAERLVGVVRRFALGMLGPQPEWHVRLLFRELTTQGPATDMILKEFLAPRWAALRLAVEPYLPGADDRTVTLHVMSVIGQILYHRLAGPVALRFLGARDYTPALAARVVEHVADFTLRSLEAARARALAEGGKAASP